MKSKLKDIRIKRRQKPPGSPKQVWARGENQSILLPQRLTARLTSFSNLSAIVLFVNSKSTFSKKAKIDDFELEQIINMPKISSI